MAVPLHRRAGMKIHSLIRDQNELRPVEVELTLWPGLPGIQFLGLPDQHLKESAIRIKSAIRAQGFKFPKAQQILVNLRPNHLKKTSRGLELAVAAAFLWKTKQLKQPLGMKDVLVYGELDLSGLVYEPEDLPVSAEGKTLLTGVSNVERNFPRLLVQNLKDLHGPSLRGPSEKLRQLAPRPALRPLWFSKSQAEVLMLAAVGEHPLLLAGPAGSGKTTMALVLHELLPDLSVEENLEIVQIAEKFGETVQFRPLVKPHHTVPMISMVGGGSVPLAGEISRAHRGLLLLDEFLEFKPQIQEALREPFEEGRIRVARGGRVAHFPAQAQIVATTNLCPCGEFVPGQSSLLSCRYSKKKCLSYSEKLSGPLLDRFEIVYFAEAEVEKNIATEVILQKIQQARQFALQENRLAAHLMSRADLEKSFTPNAVVQNFRKEVTSERRWNAILRVARSLADLRGAKVIEAPDFEKALSYAYTPFVKLQKWNV